jgi:hypothetical protein
MVSQDSVKGSSKSLKKTINEIMTFLGDDAGSPRDKLRDFLHEKLADFAEHWYKRGVRRGHMESHKEFKATGAVSAKLRYKGKRELFIGKERQVRVTSKINTPPAQRGGTKRKGD